MAILCDTLRLEWMIKERAIISEAGHILPDNRVSKPFFVEWVELGEAQIEMFATPRHAMPLMPQ